jgi:hypothetical protein
MDYRLEHHTRSGWTIITKGRLSVLDGEGARLAADFRKVRVCRDFRNGAVVLFYRDGKRLVKGVDFKMGYNADVI